MRKTLFLTIAILLTFALGASAKKTNTKPVPTIVGTITDISGKPVEGVVVSDGDEVVKTDKDGRYAIVSAKRNGWVFMSVPRGYEALSDGCFPLFWSEVGGVGVDTVNFSLKPVYNDHYVLLVVADMHLADRYSDREQFCALFPAAVKREIARAGSVPVYTYNLGDSSFDMFWYTDEYTIESFKHTMKVLKYPSQMYSCVGNHDNDGAVQCGDSTDFASARRYVKTMGPNYYSFNIGKAHYISLDNVIYLNEPGGKKFKGIKGARNYIKRVTADQLEWIKKDLATLSDKDAPVFVGMHCPAYHYSGETVQVISWFSEPEYSKELADCFEGFNNVHFLTGHTHQNYTTYVSPTLTEHNTVSLGGCWWETGHHGGQLISPNGGPAGYNVFNVYGNDMDWEMRALEEDVTLSFRACDMNVVKEVYKSNDAWQKLVEKYPARGEILDIPDNMVYINVFDWAPDWKITVTENGKELPVVHERVEDPMLTLAYQLPKITDKVPEKFASTRLNHMFTVQASEAESTLIITVTDRFGRTHTETMVRPKAFHVFMH
ncbi:MAG: calcineurin-like phosphoesterase C-terminal domain-containing protein [Bacteroidales bacterium]|nr:calcineurin-like phosphoesterase C-terminal domain-containing protein [Bacteroidales bacterium]